MKDFTLELVGATPEARAARRAALVYAKFIMRYDIDQAEELIDSVMKESFLASDITLEK